jgi:hypothetical protein
MSNDRQKLTLPPLSLGDEESWAGRPSLATRGATWCKRLLLVGRSGTFVYQSPARCRSLRCRECASYRLHCWASHLVHVFSDLESIWYSGTIWPAAAGEAQRLRNRINKRVSLTDSDYVMMRRDSLVLIFSSLSLTNRLLPKSAQKLQSQAALELAVQVGLCVPGLVHAPSWSQRWHPNKCTECARTQELLRRNSLNNIPYGAHKPAASNLCIREHR